MAVNVEVAKTAFSAGEVSPALRARSDLSKQQGGLWFLENMVVLLEGGVTRAPGTQMVLQLTPGHAYVGIPFRFAGSGSNAYAIIIGNGVAQFILGNSVVVIGGGNNNPYTVAVPYTDADLGGAGATTPGVSNLRYAVSGNVVYLFCDGYQPQTLTREADNSWVLTPYITQPAVPAPQGGCLAPVANENIDPLETIGISATQGSITLTASAALAGAAATVPNGFQAGHVGSVWRLDESSLTLTPEWTADETISPSTTRLSSSTYLGGMSSPANVFDGNFATYASQTAASGWVGCTLATPASIFNVTVNCPSGAGYFVLQAYPISFVLYAKKGSPANQTDGIVLASGSITDGTVQSITLTSNDQLTQFTSFWIVWAGVLGGNTISIAEVNFEGLASTTAATLRRWNGNVYQALNSGTSGANPPVHTSGQVLSGIGGIQWLYRNRGYGFVQITAVTNSTTATATVLERLPDSIAAQPTANWWPSAWDGVQGWPDRCFIFQNSLWAFLKNRFWRTQPGTFNNWDIPDPTSAQSGIEGGLISPIGALPWVEWPMANTSFLAIGTRDEEWVFAGQDPFSALSVENLDPYPSRQTGSAVHIPAAAEGGLVTINRARDRAMLMSLSFNGVMPQIEPQELTISARHILGPEGGGALGVSRQQDPNCINWFWCANGLLVGNTLMKEQQINGWHRHPQHAATDSGVNGIVTIPSSDEGVSWTYLLTTRTINGAQAQFVELMQPFFQPADTDAPTAAGAWFLDCALQYSGAPVTTLGGLNHLIGQSVGVHADGCTYLNPDGSLPVVNASGEITLSRPTQNAVVGLPKPYRARLLPLDLTTQKGSTVGKKQKANHLFLRVMYAAGGMIAVNPDEGGIAEPLEEPGVMTYGAPVPLRTGIIRTPGLDVPHADQTIVELTGDDTMPFTLLGVDPDVIISEDD